MRQLNLSTPPGIAVLLVRVEDDAKRMVPAVCVFTDRWVVQFDNGDPSSGGLNMAFWAPGYTPAPFTCRMTMPPDNTQNEGGVAIALTPGGSFPSKPTRDSLCAVRVGFQGVTVQTAQYGAIPAWGPELGNLSDADMQTYLATMKGLGFTHAEFAVSWNYANDGGYSYPVPGVDLSNNLGELRRRIEISIRTGFKVILFCAGDGESLPQNPDGSWSYNSGLNGLTYGRAWLMANFARLYAAFQPTAADPNDLTPFMVFCPGYDDCFWAPADVRAWWALCRSVIGEGSTGAHAYEWPAGYCHLGDGAATYTSSEGQGVDVFLQEFPEGPQPGNPPDQVWQIAGRTVPVYHRPPDQPAGDDPNPPNYTNGGTPRGPFSIVAYEFDTYGWVRGEITSEQVALDRQYLQSVGYPIVC